MHTLESRNKFFAICNKIADKQKYGDRYLFVIKFRDYMLDNGVYPNEFELAANMKLTQTNTRKSVDNWAFRMADRIKRLAAQAC